MSDFDPMRPIIVRNFLLGRTAQPYLLRLTKFFASCDGDTGDTKVPWQSEGVELDSATHFLPFCCSVILSCFTMPLKHSITDDN